MDLDKVDTGLKKAEGILETVSRIIKRFWWLLLLGLAVWFFYWALTSDFEDEVVDPFEQEVEYYEEEY